MSDHLSRILPKTDYPGPYLDRKWEKLICGDYVARGRNSAGTEYECWVVITTIDYRTHVFIWSVSDSVRVSIGRLLGNEITVYGDYQVTYVINEDGSLVPCLISSVPDNGKIKL